VVVGPPCAPLSLQKGEMQQQASYYCGARPPAQHHCKFRTVEGGNILVGRHFGWPDFFLPSHELKNCESPSVFKVFCSSEAEGVFKPSLLKIAF